ncbi:MAG TPA: ABC transporter permease, partial [Chryseolinea sp.]|nr:ABC transporter permease [Chryseolinea sp.]
MNRYRAIAIRLLNWFCPSELFEGIAGDLEEQFEADCQDVGQKKASRRMFWNVVRFFRPEILIRNKFSSPLNEFIMIQSYIKVASRNIMKRKMYSFINAVGLSIGIAFCILIYLFIMDERSFDQFQEHKESLYRLEVQWFNTWDPSAEPFSKHCWLQTTVRDALKTDFPEVEFATRFTPDTKAAFLYKDKVFTEPITFVDKDFFAMFSFPLVAGNREKLFGDKSDIVITPEIAEKYFGEEDPLGKTVILDIGGDKEFSVAGIIQSPPSNSSIDFKILVPQENRRNFSRMAEQWSNYNTPTFVQLHPNANLDLFNLNLRKMVDSYMGKELDLDRKRAAVKVPDSVRLVEYQFTRMPDIHLKKEIRWHKSSDPQYAWILGGLSGLILLIAGINYISLALTTSASRSKEVGIRKVVGALKGQLVYQFGFESIALALISMVIGVGLACIFLPSFNSFTGKAIELTYGNLIAIVGFSLIVSVVVGILAGSYPAFFLSSFRPVQVLKGKFTSKFQAGFTKPLVVMQFAFSAFLIISSIIMYKQMQFIMSKDLGYDKEQIVVIPTQSEGMSDPDRIVERFRTSVAGEPSIISVAGTTISFSHGYSQTGYKVNGENKLSLIYRVDEQYLPTLNLKLVAGRNFDPNIASDSSALIVNEALVRDMKWDRPLEEYLNWKEDSLSLGAKIIGVVQDYHVLSLENEIKPLFLSMNSKDVGNMTTLLVKIAPGDFSNSLEILQKTWNQVAVNRPFDYTFLDQDVALQYELYERWMNIMAFSTVFAILISCLGLFGLSGVNAINRTKEIGIRKVMGARLLNIFILLNRQYILLATLAFVIAAPASWYIMQKWLSDFKFAIEIGWELFAVSMAGGLLLSLLTVTYHAITTALLNPADT